MLKCIRNGTKWWKGEIITTLYNLYVFIFNSFFSCKILLPMQLSIKVAHPNSWPFVNIWCVMVNFTYQLGGLTCGQAPPSQLKAWTEQKDHLPWVRGNSPANCLLIRPAPLAFVGHQPASPRCRCWTHRPHNHISQFFLMNIFLYVFIHCFSGGTELINGT